MLGGMNDFTSQPSGSIVQFRGFSISPAQYFSKDNNILQREGPSALVAENFMSWIDDINEHHKLNLSPNHQVNTWDGTPKTISPAVPTGVYDPQFGEYYYSPFDGQSLYDRYSSGNLYHSIMDGYNANDEELWYDWCKKLSQLYQAVGVHDYFDEVKNDLYVHEGSKTFISGSGGNYLSVNTNGLGFNYSEVGQSGRVAGPKDFIISKTIFPANFLSDHNHGLITSIKIISPSSLSVAGGSYDGFGNRYPDGKIPGWYPITGANTESFYYDILTNHQGHITKSIGQPFPSPSITVRGFAGGMGIIEANTACNFNIHASSLYSCARLDTLWVDRPYEFTYYNRANYELNNFEDLIFSGVKANNGLAGFVSIYSPFTTNFPAVIGENIFHGRSISSRLDLDVTDIGKNGVFVNFNGEITGELVLVAAGAGIVPDKYWDNLKIASDLVENICGERITYYPVVRDGEACVNLAGTLGVSTSEVHRGMVFYALVGSGTMYNRYGIPTINGFEKACTDLYHSLPVNFPLVIECGKFDAFKYTVPEDPYNGDDPLVNSAILDEIKARRTEILFDQFVPSGRVDFNIKPFFDYSAGVSSDDDPDGDKKHYVFLLFRHKDSHFNFDDNYYRGVQTEILNWYNGLPVDITDEQSMIDLGKYDINSELWNRYFNRDSDVFGNDIVTKFLRQPKFNIGGFSIQTPQPVDIVPNFDDGYAITSSINFINKYVGGYWNCQNPLESLAGWGTADWTYLSRGSSGAFLRLPEQPVKYSLYDDHFDYVMLSNTQQFGSESYVYVPLKRQFDRTGNNPTGDPPYPFFSEYYAPDNTDGIVKVVPE